MKKGSALLVVLGMIAFMVVSAVAFSAYMRYSRLPSSYLRRTSSSRHLVHAALANAIDIVDAAIGNNPHPGYGTKPTSWPRIPVSGNDNDAPGSWESENHNWWRDRVYVGSNQLHQAAETVATLTLEGLAHIPPPLINEARYYSRRSEGGTWHTFDYDAGRYAFCAIDVSDYFDVNALAADVGRSMSAAGRVSLAYLLEDKDHQSYEIKPSDWDDEFMKRFRQDSPAALALENGGGSASSAALVPVVSMADFNLAFNDWQPGTWLSPFCEYAKGNHDSIYNNVSETSPEAERYRRMTFVSDGYFPPKDAADVAAGELDLADAQNQPFDPNELRDGSASPAILSVVEDVSRPAASRLAKKIARLGLVMLWDYLDEDDVPLSLAIPQVERTPMICGIKPTFPGASLKLQEDGGKKYKFLPAGMEGSLTDDNYPADFGGAKASQEGQQRTVRYTKEYRIDPSLTAGFQSGSIKAVLAYPFRHGLDAAGQSDSFTVDGHVALFFSTSTFKFRTRNVNDALHLESESDLTADALRKGVVHVPLKSQGCPSFGKVKTESEAVKEIDFPLNGVASAVVKVFDDNPILTVTWAQPQVAQKIPGSDPARFVWQNSGDATRVEATSSLAPLGENGEPDERFTSGLLGYLNGGGTEEVSLRLAVWLRVKNGSKTVDLVPACLLDDDKLNRVNNYQSMGPVGNPMSGEAYPVVSFNGGSFTFSDTGSSGLDGFAGQSVDLAPKALVCADPRWNWAPEHWYEMSDIGASAWLSELKNNWLDKEVQGGGGQPRYDRDIFMMTSDAGYLQSVYELACLPRITNLEGYGANELYGNMDSMGADMTDWPKNAQDTKLLNRHLMWHTYNVFARTGAGRDLFEFSDGEFVNKGGGIKVNPFSDSLNVVMGAFANTPTDWWTASTNVATGISKDDRLDAEKFNKTYAFSAMNANAKFAWKDLEKIGRAFIANVQAKRNEQVDEKAGWEDGWLDAFDALNWAGSDGTDYLDKFGSADTLEDTDDLYDVDRKFLYGYWRECFAPQQQLFLIFVRAEPLMMGGGAVGQTPPQLGGRGVALVWRDPKPTTQDGAPHRTRVLYYRQLE